MGKLDDDPRKYAWTSEPETNHDHRNLRVVRTIKGSKQIIELVTHGDGVPDAVGVAGMVKCAICDGVTEDRLICQDCSEAVRLVRSAGNIDVLRSLFDMINERPYILTMFERITDEAISEYFIDKISPRD